MDNAKGDDEEVEEFGGELTGEGLRDAHTPYDIEVPDSGQVPIATRGGPRPGGNGCLGSLLRALGRLFGRGR